MNSNIQTDEEIIQTNKCRFYEYYYETRDDYVIYTDDIDSSVTYSKPDTQTCLLVKRVFDNYLLSSEVTDFYKLVEVLRFCNGLIVSDDVFGLLNISSINIIFNQLYTCGITLSELENDGMMVRNILTHIESLKLKPTLLECIIYIVYKNLSDIIGSVSRVNSYESRTLSMGNGDIANSKHTHCIDVSSSLCDSTLKSGIHNNIYNYCIKWVFDKYLQRKYWINLELYLGCLKLLRFNNIISEENCSLISQTLKRFVKPDILISKLTNQWNIEFELTESLNIMKNKMITKDQKWIKALLKSYKRLLPFVPEMGNKYTLVIIDGSNWFYNPRSNSDKSKLLHDEIARIGTPAWNESIISRIKTHLIGKLSYEITEQFIKSMRILVIFNERHRPFINQICVDLDQFIIYTPRGKNDDAMALYLWLSNPGALLFSNDLYNDWGNSVAGNNYLMGLWAMWSNCLKISK